MNHQPCQRAAKRMMDVTASFLLLVLFGPLMLVVWLLVRWKMGKPAIFRHRRPGWRSTPFLLYKFRTMTDARDSNGELLPDRERLTALGMFLRRFSLDELPQLWNVFRGDMSLVGPRPLLMAYLDRYTSEQARRRLDVAPGITGWAQINGRNAISWEEKFDLDTWYVDHWSLWLDLRILLATVRKVVRREGISAASHSTMPEFTRSTQKQKAAT